MAKRYETSPVAFVGVATPESAGSAASVRQNHGASFPNAVDLGNVTYALYGVKNTTSSYGFVIDERGTVVYGYNLGYVTRTADGRIGNTFEAGAKSHLDGATDPFGITAVPAKCEPIHALLKTGQLDQARSLAGQLKLSSDQALKAFGLMVIAAVDGEERARLGAMEALASEGKAGELEVEAEAFRAAFPRSASKAASLQGKAGSTQAGRDEAAAAANFAQVAQLLKRNSSTTRAQAVAVCQAVVARYPDTHYGKIMRLLVENFPQGR
jgi:hypothetical protein